METKRELEELSKSAENLRKTLEEVMESAKIKFPEKDFKMATASANFEIIDESTIDESTKTSLRKTLTALTQSRQMLKNLSQVDVDNLSYSQNLDRIAREMIENLDYVIKDKSSSKNIKKMLNEQMGSSTAVKIGNRELKSNPILQNLYREYMNEQLKSNKEIIKKLYEEYLRLDGHESDEEHEKMNYDFYIDDTIMVIIDSAISVADKIKSTLSKSS